MSQGCSLWGSAAVPPLPRSPLHRQSVLASSLHRDDQRRKRRGSSVALRRSAPGLLPPLPAGSAKL